MGAGRTPFRLFYKVGRMSPPGPFFVGFHDFPSHLARRDVHLSAESLHKATQGGWGVVISTKWRKWVRVALTILQVKQEKDS